MCVCVQCIAAAAAAAAGGDGDGGGGCHNEAFMSRQVLYLHILLIRRVCKLQQLGQGKGGKREEEEEEDSSHVDFTSDY